MHAQRESAVSREGKRITAPSVHHPTGWRVYRARKTPFAQPKSSARVAQGAWPARRHARGAPSRSTTPARPQKVALGVGVEILGVVATVTSAAPPVRPSGEGVATCCWSVRLRRGYTVRLNGVERRSHRPARKILVSPPEHQDRRESANGSVFREMFSRLGGRRPI